MILGNVLLTATNAVAPIVLLILLGYSLKRIGYINAAFIKLGKRLVFQVFLPCMLFVNVYDIDSFAAIKWDIVLYCAAAAIVIFLLSLLSVGLYTNARQRKGVIIQCAFRSNFALIGMPLASYLGGAAAMAIAAVISSFVIPVFNVLSVVALSIFVETGTSRKDSAKQIARNIAKNPLIIAIALGLGCLLLREAQTAAFGNVVFSLRTQGKILYTVLNNLKSIASPFALIILGGEFELSAVKGMGKEIVAGTLWRLVLAPLLGIGTAILLSTRTGLLTCGPDTFPALIALFGSPAAVSSVVMAGAMGNDEQLAAQLVVWTSLLSIATIFLQVCLLMGFGYLPM